MTAKGAARALFDSEDHPAVRDALAMASVDYPTLFAHAQARLAALFRRILPVKLSLVTDWAEAPLMEQAALLQPITEQVVTFSQMGVPALLESALESTRAPTGMFDKLFRRGQSPFQYKPALSASRAQLLQLMADSEAAMRALEESAQNLSLHGAVLAVVAKLAASAPDPVPARRVHAAPHADPAGRAPGGTVDAADGADAPAGRRPDRADIGFPDGDLAGTGDGAGARESIAASPALSRPRARHGGSVPSNT
ncbi:hypothetical protein [Massilia sp. Se16.2.3]|uniref:hypothetical protein n=1 Tax=Massilia sp. Se16.2.3 TaxID=2709303 RepID=UPI001604749F|nr:hypothetical protein [Massilia sp. Se16.2.3]QNA98664.1 hypothetical protein G4G31_07195 [Massilia sp. Se16.2.3]